MLIEQKHLKALRRLAGLSQQQVAEYCNTNRSQIDKAETMGNIRIQLINNLSSFYKDYFTALRPYLSKPKMDELNNLIIFK